MGEKAVVEREGYESVEEEDCWVWDLVEDRESVGYGEGGG